MTMRAFMAGAAQAARTVGYLRFVAHCKDVRASQEATLARLVRHMGRTQLGRRLGCSLATSLENFQRWIPLTEYEDYAPYVEATLAGTPNVMVPEPPLFFALTAGTTGHSKLVPITRAYRREIQVPIDAFMYGIYRDHPAVRTGRLLLFAGPAEIRRSPSGVLIGTGSGYSLKTLPSIIRKSLASPYEAFIVRQARSRSYAVALTALRHEVSAIFTPTTLMLALLGEAMRSAPDALLRDLAEGTFNPPGPVTDAERAVLAPYLRPDPARARELTRRSSAAGALLPRTAWPSLALLGSWFHGSAGSHVHELDELYGAPARRSLNYSATECYVAVPDRDDDPTGVLALGAHVFEFIPLDAHGRRAGDPVLADALAPGRRYSLVVTSGAGLWRYQMHDVVECTGFFYRAPRLMFVHKEGNVLDFAHVQTSESHVRQAIELLLAEGVPLRRYCFGPDRGRPLRYALVVEAGPGLERDALAAAFERALKKVHAVYADYRYGEVLAPAEVYIAGRERFAGFDRAQASRDAGAQGKPVVFCKSTEFLADLLGEEAREPSS